ncbi:MAG: ABC-2 family transporter protein [Candidatus Eremiobacteraeota bacterium]|nr:ABC-2 family transporter protein [Candidatus Eremiobacteraeota bacterium]
MSVVRFEPAPRSLRDVLAPYLAFAAKAFSREATYRMEVFTNVGSLVVRLYLMKTVWTALYAQNAAPAGVPLHAVLTYTVVALLMSLVLEIDGTRAIRDKIHDGSIATDLMKPISLPFYFFSDGVGMTLLHAVLIVPALLVSLLLVHIDVPPPHVLAAFAVSFLLGYLVNFLLNFLMNCVAFWTLETFAIQLMVRWVSDLLSGQIVPLIFFPGLLQKIVLALPFAAIYSTPLLIYLGTIPPSGYLAAMATQLAWGLAFAILSAIVWRAAQRRVVVQGG